MHSDWVDAAERELVAALAELGDPDDAAAMAAYMRDQFPFFGVRAPERRAAWAGVRHRLDPDDGLRTADEVLMLAGRLWDGDQRELQLVAADSLVRHHALLDADHLDRVRSLLTTRAWWDTVDVLAPKVVGPMARRDPAVVAVLDRWVRDADQWLVRSAVLHQPHARGDTDVERLARYCTAAAPRREFFVRKAVGWALRQYSYVDALWVVDFVARTELSGLSSREALRAVRRRGRGQ